MKINIVQIDKGNADYIFDIKIDDYKYRVTFTDEYYKKLTSEKISPEELVRKSFEFLLEREGPESILSEFDLPTIQKYFSEYEAKISKF
ncbi:MAG: hypothetical protein WD885_02700 [Candidatus Saccharimonadales bacterium]